MTPQEKLSQLMNLRQHWEQVCDAERRSQERNQKLLRELELLDTRTNTLSLQTERLRLLKDQYKTYVCQIWPLWLEMQKPERVPRSSTPKNTSNRHTLTSPESHISANFPAVKPTSSQHHTTLAREPVLVPTNLFRMPPKPVSVMLRKSNELDVSSSIRGRPGTSDAYIYTQRNVLIDRRPPDSLRSVHKNHYNKLPLTTASLHSLHRTQNVQMQVNNRSSLAVLKRYSFSGFPSSRQTSVPYPGEILPNVDDKHNWATQWEAAGVEESAPLHVPISPNFSKLRIKRVEAKAERDLVKDKHVYGRWEPNPLSPPPTANFKPIPITPRQENQIAGHPVLHNFDPPEELYDTVPRRLPLQPKNAVPSSTEYTSLIPINSKLVFSKNTEIDAHLNSTGIALYGDKEAVTKSVPLKSDAVVLQTIAASPASQLDINHCDKGSKLDTVNREAQHPLDSSSTHFNTSSGTNDVVADLGQTLSDPVSNGQQVFNDIDKNNQNTGTSVFTNVLQTPNDWIVKKQNTDTESVMNTCSIPCDVITNDQRPGCTLVTSVQNIASDFVKSTLGHGTREANSENFVPIAPVVQTESLNRELTPDNEHDPVRLKAYHRTECRTATDNFPVANSVQAENVVIEPKEILVVSALDVRKASLEECSTACKEVAESKIAEIVAAKSEESDDEGSGVHGYDTDVQLLEVQKTISLLQQSDSESDKDSFFDNDVKPSVIGSAAYMNLLQANDSNSQEVEDSDEVENELAARVALPIRTLNLDNPVDDPSTSVSSDNPDKKQPDSQPLQNSPKGEQRAEHLEQKKTGWKMSAKEKFSALGMSVDSDSDVDIPHAAEAASDKDDFSF